MGMKEIFPVSMGKPWSVLPLKGEVSMVKSRASATEERKRFKLLLVEDRDSLRQLFKEDLLKQFPKMLIEEAPDGIEALQKVTSFDPDLVFMDIHLPDENGLELTRRIKSQYPRMKIVILTVYDFPEYREAAQRCGVEDFVIKGLTSWREIVALVRSISSKIGKPI